MDEHTPIQRFRASRLLWQTYGEVCKSLGKNRSADLVAHMRRMIQRHGTAEQKARLTEVDAEVADRLERKHAGRPPTIH